MTDSDFRSDQNDPTGWPSARGDQATIRAELGPEATSELGRALQVGDPLADAVVTEQNEHGRVASAQLALGLRHGLVAVDDPLPATAAFLRAAEEVAIAAEADILDRASMPHFSVPSRVHAVGLGIGGLLHLYQSPSIAKVLAGTGRLLEGAGHRISQTARWQAQATIPGSLRPGADGYVQTLQVRLMHATMRRMVARQGYRSEEYGTPINQLDLARTWVDFTRHTYLAEQELGYDYTDDELADLYRYWRHVGLLLGVEPTWLAEVNSHESAARITDLTAAVTGPPVEESRQLSVAALSALTTVVTEVFGFPPLIASATLRALARRVHGDQQAVSLGLDPAPAAEAGLALSIATTRTRRSLHRRRTGAWQRLLDTQLEATRQMLAG